MIQNLTHIFNLAHHQVREVAKNQGGIHGALARAVTGEVRRSSQWPAKEKEYLAKNPTCKACGGTDHMNVHHEKPFHLHPKLELDDNNLIGLCMGKKECHLKIGHGDNFRAYNPNVVKDAATVLADPSKFDAVAANAKATRLVQ